MKRLMLLVSLSACVCASAAFAANTLYLTSTTGMGGIYLEGKNMDAGNYIKTVGTWGASLSSGSRNYQVTLAPGLKVVKWEYRTKDLTYTDLEQSGTNVVWTYNKDLGSIGLRPYLEWLHYDLSYNANGGAGTMAALPDISYTNEVALADCGFTRTGYDFIGWSLQETGGMVWPSGTVLSGADFGVTAQNDDFGKDAYGTPVSLYARWSPQQYTVTFKANCDGGTCVPAQQTVTYDAPYGELPTPSRPDKPGYAPGNSWRFDGWYTDPTNGTRVTADQTVKVTSAVTLYAHWTERFKVTWSDASQFDNVLLKTEYILVGESATAPDSPSHEQWTFDRWTGFDGTSNVRQERAYTAAYTENTYMIRFNACNGTGATKQEQFSCATSKNLPPNTFVRRGYTFLGWDTDPAAVTVVFEEGHSVLNLASSGTVDLYAVWTPNTYTICFDGNGASSGAMEPLTSIVYDTPVTLPPNAFIYGELDFLRWHDDLNNKDYLDGSVVSNLTGEANGSVTLKAVWFDGYFVQFDGNGATSGEMPRQLVPCDTDVPLSSNAFVRTGYLFAGWKNNATDRTYADGAVVRNLVAKGGSVTLTAVWEPIRYSIRFDDNGANSGDMAVQSFIYDQPQPLFANAYKRRLHSFAGWATTPDATVAQYTDKQSVSQLFAEHNGTNVLYAVWESTLSSLSVAADCNNLQLEASLGMDQQGLEFTPFVVSNADSYTNGTSCCGGLGNSRTMHMVATCGGRLLFRAKVSGTGSMNLYRNAFGQSAMDVSDNVVMQTQSTLGWKQWTVAVAKNDTLAWVWLSQDPTACCWVDEVIWQPDSCVLQFTTEGASAPADISVPLGECDKLPSAPVRPGYTFLGWRLGEDPTLYAPRADFTPSAPKDATFAFTAVWERSGDVPIPTEDDAVVISTAILGDGALVLSFESNADFDYELRASDDLLADKDDWTAVETKPGTGETLTFEPAIDPAQLHRFYCVRTVPRGGAQ